MLHESMLEANSQNRLISQRLEQSELEKERYRSEIEAMKQALAEKDEISRQLLEEVKRNMQHRRR